MASDYFDFKQFRIWHNQVAMKVGTDAVVLACLVKLTEQAKTVLDIGTGSGIIALMLAQRDANAQITAIEINALAAQQAQINFEQSKFAKQLFCKHISLQDYEQMASQKFDLIVSNPPFFEQQRNVSITNKARSLARQDAALPFVDLAKSVSILLKPQGSFWLILPVQEAAVFYKEAKSFGLNLQYQVNIIPNPNKVANRLVQCYQFSDNKLVQTELILKNEEGLPSSNYINLSREFYLRMD
jgi:tRNA1Val (adenine37-N6)-methyltransferase